MWPDSLVARLPSPAIFLLVQHILPAYTTQKVSGVDVFYFVLQAGSEKLTAGHATSLISTVFAEVEKRSHC